jgi:amino acid adenylation domain-containing protein
MNTRFTLVANDYGAYGLWPMASAIPAGWHPDGFDGSKADCLTELLRRGEPRRPVPDTGGETLLSVVAQSFVDFPDRLAVCDDTVSMTYAELRAHAAAVTDLLTGHGVRPGDRVVVYLQRSAWTVVAVLGVLGAGAAYVAVDPRYPDQRRDVMIEGARSRFVLTEPDWVDRLPSTVDRVVVGREKRSAGDDDSWPRPVGQGDVASVLFTSGSTGRPKAIELEHGNLVYFATNAALPAVLSDDRVGQVSSVSFDAYHYEVWRALACGAAIVVLPDLASAIGNDLRRELRKRRVTAMLAPTMAINHVVYEDQDAFASLRLLHTGGDVLQRGASAKLMAGSFAGEFHNLYGPAEGSTACTAYRVNDLAPEAEVVPIGTPLDGASVYLLGPDLTEVPDGTVGEIHIGGAGVARGYLGAPDLTVQRFLPDPFGKPGGRMYATGDLGRRSPAGLLEFVGRTDDQVKIRGYRVEPGEVERVLTTHPAVRETAVVAVGDGQDRRLVALVAVQKPASPTELRAFATDALPAYLVPSSFVQVPAIPATDHGKRDLERLRELASDHERRQRAYQPPADEVERYLARVWEEMLGVDRVSRSDDFFALGGNSLLAFRLQRRISREIGSAVDIRALLATTSLAAVADLVRDTSKEAR